MLDSVCRLWENERDFRRLFEAQPVLCLPHFSRPVSYTHLFQRHIEKHGGQPQAPH